MRGSRHAHYRKLIVPPLRRDAVAALSGNMERLAERAVDTWPVDAPFDLWARIRDLMQEAAVTHLFGAERGLAMPVAGQINALAQGSFSLAVNAFPFDLPGTPFARMMRGSERLETAILAWADALRGPTALGDLMSIIVNSPDEDGNPPADDLIVGHAPTLLGAAYETCQNAMIWSLVLLAGHPAIQEALAEDIAAGDLPVSADGLAPLSLLDRVVRESMRLLPPVPTQYRVAVEDTTLGDTPLHRDCRAVLSAFVRNRDPDLYPEPDRFIPARWANIDPSPFEYAAFSAGPRSCPGFHFGIAQVKSSLKAILRRYRVEVAPDAAVGYRVGVTLRPHPGVAAVLRPRASAGRPRPVTGPINRLVRFPQP
jgi:cytochrome P450